MYFFYSYQNKFIHGSSLQIDNHKSKPFILYELLTDIFKYHHHNLLLSQLLIMITFYFVLFFGVEIFFYMIYLL